MAIGSYLAERGLVQLGSYRARHDNPIPSLPSLTATPALSLALAPALALVVAHTKPGEAQNQARHLGPGLRQRQPPQSQPNRVARERGAPCAMRLLYGKVQLYCTFYVPTHKRNTPYLRRRTRNGSVWVERASLQSRAKV